MRASLYRPISLAVVVLTWGLSSSGGLSSVGSAAQGLTPDESVSRMKMADGFEISVVAAEPLVRQPVAIEFDDRGRLWVIQYLQYPNPNGLKRVKVDRYSRTEYDHVPPPPPKGPRGADRITILEDTNGDGRMDRGRDFVSGLNLATGLAFGHGGVFVLNVPYLLFYPDRNRDDIPDSDPEVLLTGFGMEDAHSVANSLTWGPDGWLYGCQGSTVTAKIRGIEFQQGVWRYHPVTREFELFCEGGGNSWGLDFDRAGRLLYSTNYGGHVLLHGVQGGYFVKSFGKHGALHNPHAYGYFDHAPHQNFRGGHVTVGGIVYQGDLFPDSFRGKYIAGDLLGHGVYWHKIQSRGSTVGTAHGGELLISGDSWFAPTDLTMGPDGAIYVADWHDARTAHPDPDAEWDRSNGRIYRIAPRQQSRNAKGNTQNANVAQQIPSKESPSITSNARRAQELFADRPLDFTNLSASDLLLVHRHPSQWHVRHARQELARRFSTKNPAPPPSGAAVRSNPTGGTSVAKITTTPGAKTAAAPTRLETQNTANEKSARDSDRRFLINAFRKQATTERDETMALEALWSLQILGGFDEVVALNLLESPHPAVRSWTVRFLGDRRHISEKMAHRLDEFAEQEPVVDVRQQIACSAARLPARHALPMINANINRDIDNADPYLPLLWWWAVEKHSVSGREEVLKRFTRASLWKSRLGRETLLPRLVRRYAAEGTPAALDSLARLVKAAPSPPARMAIWSELLIGWQERPRNLNDFSWLESVNQHPLAALLLVDWKTSPANITLWKLGVLFRLKEPRAAATRDAFEVKTPTAHRVMLLEMLRMTADPSLIQPSKQLVASNQPESVRIAAIQLLSRFEDPEITRQLIAVHRTSRSEAINSQIRDILLGRRESAKAWVEAVDRGDIPASSTPLEQIRRVAVYADSTLDAIVTKHWGKLQGATRGEMLAEVRRLNNDLRAGSGNPVAGKILFTKHCAACHQLFGEGTKLGPDLTTANRQDREFLLVSLVDPSSVIRKEYVSVIVQTTGGRVINGMPVARTNSEIVLVVDARTTKKVTIPTAEIEELRDSDISLMPGDLYRQLKPQELRDLFAYLQKQRTP